MLKSELLKQLENIKEDEDINETIQGIEDFAKSSKFDVTKVTLEDYKNMLANNNEIKGYYQSTLDSSISKAVNSHDEKFKKEKLPSLIEKAIKEKSNEGKTPEQIQLAELQAKLNAMEQEKAKAELLNTNSAKLKEKGLDTSLAKYISTDEDIEFFGNLISNSVNNGVNEKLNNNNYVPPTTTGQQALSGVEKAFFERTGLKLD